MLEGALRFDLQHDPNIKGTETRQLRLQRGYVRRAPNERKSDDVRVLHDKGKISDVLPGQRRQLNIALGKIDALVWP